MPLQLKIIWPHVQKPLNELNPQYSRTQLWFDCPVCPIHHRLMVPILGLEDIDCMVVDSHNHYFCGFQGHIKNGVVTW